MKINAFHRLDAAAYHADPCPTPALSASIAKLLVDKSPRHAWLAHPRLGGRRSKPTSSMDTGTLVHALLLEAGANIVMIEACDYKTKAAQIARDEAKAAGKIPVTLPALSEALDIVSALRSELDAFGIRLSGRSEVTAIWMDPDPVEPVLCRGMFDHLIEDRGIIYDVKTIASAHPDKCARQMSEYGYDVQWAAYTSALRTIRPDLAGREDFVFLFCETEPPYCVTPVRPDGQFRQLGELRWHRAVRTWAECLKADKWPGYATDVIDVAPMPWAMARELGHAA